MPRRPARRPPAPPPVPIGIKKAPAERQPMVPGNTADNLGKVVGYGGSAMRGGFLVSAGDRLRTNIAAVRAAPVVFVLAAVVAFAIPAVAVSRIYGERLALLENKLALEAALAAEYRAKLRAEAPERTAAEVEKLTALAADLRQRLTAQNEKIAALEQHRNDGQRLYADGTPIALVRDPQIDLADRKVTFPSVTAGMLLAADKSYRYQDWKLACGGSQSYSVIDEGGGAAPEFAYSHLVCRIVGGR